jgi:hypothetical protein
MRPFADLRSTQHKKQLQLLRESFEHTPMLFRLQKTFPGLTRSQFWKIGYPPDVGWILSVALF